MEKRKIEENLTLFINMVSATSHFYIWQCDSVGQVIESTSPNAELYLPILEAYGCADALLAHAAEYDVPYMLSTPVGIYWFAAFDKKESALNGIWLVGPFLSMSTSSSEAQNAVNQCPVLAEKLLSKHELVKNISTLPIITNMLMHSYATMIHYCVTGESISASELMVNTLGTTPEVTSAKTMNREKARAVEFALTKCVREGNLNYRDVLNSATFISDGVELVNKDPIRQAKTSVIVAITLCSRAAIEGGLSAEQAHSLGDSYIQMVEDCRNIAEVGGITNAMMEDYINRVRTAKQEPKLSKYIRTCRDYIDIHPEDDLSIKFLADYIGYTEYYLSRRFKQEVGIGINDYIKQVRIEKAKMLLKATDESIQNIAVRLNFCSRSHFCEVFKKIAGTSPAQYREDESAE